MTDEELVADIRSQISDLNKQLLEAAKRSISVIVELHKDNHVTPYKGNVRHMQNRLQVYFTKAL